MSTLNHTHSYRRIDHKTRRDLFICTDPQCTFKQSAAYLLGKIALCPHCKKEYVMTKLMLRKLKNLHCKECNAVRGSKETEAEKEQEVTADAQC